MRVWTWNTLPAPNFVKVSQGDLSLGGKFFTKIRSFYQKFQIFGILSYLSPHFCTHSVEILLKKTDSGIHQRHKGLAGIALPSEVMNIDF